MNVARTTTFLTALILTVSAYADGLRIDNGRQLFIDDALIQETNLQRVWHDSVNQDKQYEAFTAIPYETVILDGGYTWTESKLCPAANVSSRTFVTELSGGEWLMVKHGANSEILNSRARLTALISFDEGETWQGGLEIDPREGCSYHLM